ncbi:serine/threonine protein kinase, CMGC group, partial [Borealophlyctis nickersoniae]
MSSSSYANVKKAKAAATAASAASVSKKRRKPPPAASGGGGKPASGSQKKGDFEKRKDRSDDDSYVSDDESVFSEEEEDAEDYCKGGYHPVNIGDSFNEGRYTILRKLGWGHFSTVWLAQDLKFDRPVALKIVKSAPHYTETALDEIKLLDKVVSANRESPQRGYVVELLDWFKHRGPHGTHVCMAFEVLGPNLLTLIRQYHHRGIPAPIVKRIIKQVLMGLDYLHRECGIIHTDLKPENVLIGINVEETLRRLGLKPSKDAGVAKMDVDPSSSPVPQSPAGSGASTPKEENLGNMTYAQRKRAKYKLKKQAQKKSQTHLGNEAQNGKASSQASTPAPSSPDVEMSDVGEPKQLARTIGARDKDPTGSLLSLGSTGSLEIPSGDGTGAATDALGRNLSDISLGDVKDDRQSAPDSKLRAQSQEAAKDKARLEEERPKERASGKGPDVERKRRRREEKKEIRMKQDERIRVKLADLGNACWVDHHFTNDIQTRQYRSPEAILGARYDTSADMWSLGCMVFELLTGDYMFDPQAGTRYTKDDDHIAQIVELLGDFPSHIALSGKWSSEIFNRKGQLRHIHKLRYWKLADVLHEKYHFSKEDSDQISAFILPMIDINPARRASAAESLRSPWISSVEIDDTDAPPHIHRGFPARNGGSDYASGDEEWAEDEEEDDEEEEDVQGNAGGESVEDVAERLLKLSTNEG